MRSRRSFASLCTLALAGAATARPPLRLPARQLIVAVADGWESSRGRLMLFERPGPERPWQAVLPAPVPVLFGKNGLAWGHGVLPVPHGRNGIPSKREKDRRAPAGLFRIGRLFGETPEPPPGVTHPYYQITARDCWIDDPASPDYNRHVVVDPARPPSWYAKQRMRLGDFAYEWLLEVRHNADPAIPGHGSAIFFHIRRGVNTPTHGCTTMARPDLLSLLRRLKPEGLPHYVLLPKAEYAARINAWDLPADMP